MSSNQLMTVVNFPQSACLVVLVSLFHREATSFIHGMVGGAGKQDRSLLDRTRLMEIPTKEDGRDVTEVFRGLSKPA